MVEVVTKEEFDKFTKLMEDRLDKMEESTKKSMDARVKLFAAINTRLDEVEADCVTAQERIDDVEEKSKSVITRIKEAFEEKPESKI